MINMKNILMMTDDGYDNGNRIKFVIFFISVILWIQYFSFGFFFLKENESNYHRQIIFIHIHLFLLISLLLNPNYHQSIIFLISHPN